MVKRLVILYLIVCLQFIFAGPVLASDFRTLKVAKFLTFHDSPLVYYAPDFVRAADANGLDYRLLVAISGVESSFGKNYLPSTFNTYGWGGGQIAFSSWPDGINQVSEGLKKGYLKKGLAEVEDIARVYCPPNSAHWAAGVSHFMQEIDSTDVTGFQAPQPEVAKKLPLTL